MTTLTGLLRSIAFNNRQAYFDEIDQCFFSNGRVEPRESRKYACIDRTWHQPFWWGNRMLVSR